jgi:hypothetical protein
MICSFISYKRWENAAGCVHNYPVFGFIFLSQFDKQAAALNKQGNLNEFFDITVGTGVYAPRKRQPYASKRLQQVISDFRGGQVKRRDALSISPLPEEEPDEDAEGPPKRRKTAGKAKANRGGSRARVGAYRLGKRLPSRGREMKATQMNTMGMEGWMVCLPHSDSSSNRSERAHERGSIKARDAPKPY